MTRPPSRRRFLQHATLGATALALDARSARAQIAGERPARAEGVTVLNPRGRVPVGLIIDDSTCLVNLNRFAMPQFDTAFGGREQEPTSATGASGRWRFPTRSCASSASGAPSTA